MSRLSRRAGIGLILLSTALAVVGLIALSAFSSWLSGEIAGPLQTASADVLAVNLEWLIATLVGAGITIGVLAALALDLLADVVRRRATTGAAERCA